MESISNDSFPQPLKVRVVLCDTLGHVMLGRTTDGDCKWGLPGGAIEPSDQDVLAAAKREVAEETGALDCTNWRVVYVDKARGTWVCAAQISPDAQIDPSQDPDQEFSDIRFFKPSQVQEMRGSVWEDARKYVSVVSREIVGAEYNHSEIDNTLT